MSKKRSVAAPPQDPFAHDIARLRERVDAGIIPPPTRLFEVGEEVVFGAHKHTVVTEVLLGGYGYIVHCEYMGEVYGRPMLKKSDHAIEWFSLNKHGIKASDSLLEDEDLRVGFSNTAISGLLNKVYFFGVDFDPPYQRGLAWEHWQEVALIESIFNRVDIGKFVFVDRGVSDARPKMYEILDGKQRLTAICRYFEDRFEWRGRRLSDLCHSDYWHFKNYQVAIGEVRDATEAQILKQFVKLNTGGVPMSQEHINKVKAMIEKGEEA